MTRIPYPDPATLPEADREFLAQLPPLNISRMLAGSPSLFRPLTQVFNAYLNHGEMDPVLREVAILRVASRLDSEYELLNHRRAGRVVGMEHAHIDAVIAPGVSKQLSRQEQLVVQFVDEVIDGGAASEKTFRKVEASMTVAELIELSVVIGVYTMVSQICATFEIEPEIVPIKDTGLEEIFQAVRDPKDT